MTERWQNNRSGAKNKNPLSERLADTQIGSKSTWSGSRYQGCTTLYSENIMLGVLEEHQDGITIEGRRDSMQRIQPYCAEVRKMCCPSSNGSKKPASPKTYCLKNHGVGQRRRKETGLNSRLREMKISEEVCLRRIPFINTQSSNAN